MPAQDHHDEVEALFKHPDINKGDVPANFKAQGVPAPLKSTPNNIPLLREWEFGSGPVIAFSVLDSCLGAVQLVNGTLHGVHFSELHADYIHKAVETSDYAAAMERAGFVKGQPVLFLGGNAAWQPVRDELGYAQTGFPLKGFADDTQHWWIFAVEQGSVSYVSYR